MAEPNQKDFTSLLEEYRLKQATQLYTGYSVLYDNMKQTNDPDQLLDNLKKVFKQFSANFRRIDFFQVNFPPAIFNLAVNYYQNKQLFNGCCNLLRLVLSEQSSALTLLNHINKCLHKDSFNRNIVFFSVVANIVTDQGAAQTFLRSSCPQLLIKFYRKFVLDHGYNSQLLDALSLEQYQLKIDRGSDDGSEKSGNTVASSLSLDEDGFQYRQRKLNKKKQNDLVDDTPNDALNQVAGLMFEDEDQIQPSNNGDEQNDNSQLQDENSRDFDDNMDEAHYEYDGLQHNIDDYQDPPLIEEQRNVQNNTNVDQIDQSRVSPAKIVESYQKHQTPVPRPDEHLARRENKMMHGPLQLASNFSQRPSFVPQLQLVLIPAWTEHNENEIQQNSRTAALNQTTAVVDQQFQQQLNIINERRLGNIVLQETGNLIGQFIAMGDYPVVMQIKTSQQVQLSNMVIQRVDKYELYYQTYFGYSNCREVTDYNFDFDYFNNILPRVNMNDEDSRRIGICYIFMSLLKQSPQMVSQFFQQLWSVFVYDLLYLKQKKSGFVPASVLSVSHLMSQISNVYLPTMQDEWLTALIQMYDYIGVDLDNYDVEKDSIVSNQVEGKTFEKVHLILPSIVYMLQRLEGYRRNFYPEIQLLATQLKNCCKFHSHLAAIEDLPKILGVLVDRFECSQSCYSVRSAMTEAILPALLKILELIVSRKIKQRQYITFVSHRLLQLFSALTQQPQYIYQSDFQQSNINQLFTNIFIHEDIEVNAWLKRYAYLITMNSRVKLELSGLFVSQQQCDITIEEMRITFGQFCKNLASLIKRHIFISKYNDSNVNIMDGPNIIFPAMSNLQERQYPLGDDQEFDLDVKLIEQPLHCILASIKPDAILQQKNKNVFLQDNTLLDNKFCIQTNKFINFSSFTYLLDFDTGVLSQYLQLNQSSLLKLGEGRKSYSSCLDGLIELVSLPHMLQIIPQQQLNKHIIFHYLSFIKFYNLIIETVNSNFSVSNSTLAKKHLVVLIAFAVSDNIVIRQHLLIIKVIDFLVQQLMYESNSSDIANTGRLAMNSVRQQQQLVTNLNDDMSDTSNEQKSNLDFGLDSDDDVPPPPKSKAPAFVLKLPVAGKAQKEEKDQEGKYAEVELKQKSNVPSLILNMNQVDTPKIQDEKTLDNQIDSIDENQNQQTSLKICLPPLIQVQKSPIKQKEVANKQQIVLPSLAIKDKKEDRSKESPILKTPKINANNMDSDSDGWSDVAKRLNIDLGEKKQVIPKQLSKSGSDSKTSETSSSEPPPIATKQKIILPKLSLGIVPPKTQNEKEKSQTVELPKIDINVKMHLVLGKNTGGDSSRQQASIPDSSEGKLNNQPDSINNTVANDSNDDIINNPEQSKIPMIPLYFDHELHYEIISFIFCLIINPKTGTLDTNYVTQFPSNIGMYNIPVILHNHLNNERNKEIVKMLMQKKQSALVETLVRLLCYQCFNSDIYQLQKFQLLAKGAYGEVYQGVVDFLQGDNNKKFGTPIAIKVQKLNTNLQDRCVLYDLYNEISVMQKLQSSMHFCQLLDFGVTPQGYIMVMKRYYTSFKNFREQLMCQPQQLSSIKLIYRNIGKKMVVYGHEYSMMKYVRIILQSYVMFLEHLKEMHNKKIIHFDLKADNIFVQPASVYWNMMQNLPSNGGSFVDELFSKHSHVKSPNDLPFLLTIADFGESYVFSGTDDQNTLLSKGTEFNKSPEMLLSTNQQFSKINRRSQKGAGVPSDLWSAACTLYEMLTCDFLFYDSDWIRFFIRATQTPSKILEYAKDSFTFSKMNVIAQQIRGIKIVPEKRALLGNCQPLIDLLEFQLVPDATQRPDIQTCIEMTQFVLKTYFPPEYSFENEFYQNSIYEQPVTSEIFPVNSWFFDLFGSANECMFNSNEILTPKVSIICKDNIVSNTRLTQAKPIKISEPSDIFLNGLLILGSIFDVNNIKYLNEANIQTVIDCSSTNIKQYYTIINHIFRPSPKLIQIFNQQESTDLQFKDFIIAIEQVFDVIRCGMLMNGSVLIIDETGLEFAAMMAIAALMEFEGFYLYNAIIYMKRLRPMIKLNQNFLQILNRWHDTRKKIGIQLINQININDLNPNINRDDPVCYHFLSTRVAQANYRCICGKVYFVVKPGKTMTYVACNCAVSDKLISTYHHGKVAHCPSYSCRSIMNFFRQYYGYKTDKLLWCFIEDEAVISTWKRATIAIADTPSFVQSENQQLQFYRTDESRQPLIRLPDKDGWTMQICRLCGYPTHFCKKDKQGLLQLAILCNFSNK